MIGQVIGLVERGLVPDGLTRWGIRRLLSDRLATDVQPFAAEADAKAALAKFAAAMDQSPLALHTPDANKQHYEVPARFFEVMLGPRLKYSSCYYPHGTETLAEAEDAMLALTAQRAGLVDGMSVLDLGCGWGSFTLWVAEHFPKCRVTSVSNSHGQRLHIEARLKARGWSDRVTVLTRDMNELETDETFDRVVSVEMFEHLRNHRQAFAKVARWLKPGGRFFMHIFCHRSAAYAFGTAEDDDWMGRHFFTGGMMPAWDLPLAFQDHLQLVERFQVNGEHYAKTCRHWLENLDARRGEAEAALGRAPDGAAAAWQRRRWRIFVLACEELFAWGGGTEWFVGHYLFERRADAARN
jgi:cyclopropane-fatty-acyl-phospholipid synthase